MTNAEAIEILRANYPDACYEQLREAVDAAIEALKAQDATGDTIFRQAAIDAVESFDILDGYTDQQELIYRIRQLPSVQPEPCEDTISRADTIRVASGYCHPANVAKELAKLPSVQPEQPEIVRCKDCKYLLPKGSFCSKDMCCLRGMAHYHNVDIHNDFCSWGEVEDE